MLFLAIILGLGAAYYTGNLDVYIAEAKQKLKP